MTMEEVIERYYEALIKAMKEYCALHTLYPWEVKIDTEVKDDQLVINLYFKGAPNNDK